MRPKIVTCLWFDHNAEEALRFYDGVFGDVEVLEQVRSPGDERYPAGALVALRFRMAGQIFDAINGGPLFRFTEAVSLVVDSADQAEVDRLWAALLAGGGQESQCGWLKDRFGLSWQIVPRSVLALFRDADPARAARAWNAMLGMVKLDIAALERAAAGTP